MAIQKKKPGKCIVVSKFMRGEDCQVLITYWYGFIGAGSRGINDNGPLIMVATPTEDYSGADWRSDARALLQRGYVAMTGFVEGGNVA